MSKVESFNKKKAVKEGDCRYLTVVDILEECLEDVDKEEYNWTKAVCVFYNKNEATGTFTVDYRCSGVTALELRGLVLSMLKEELEP